MNTVGNDTSSTDTPKVFITKKIHGMFCALAEHVSSMEFTEDESAGVPMILFAAENYLLECWKAYTQDEAQRTGKVSGVHLPNCPVYPRWPWPPDHTA